MMLPLLWLSLYFLTIAAVLERIDRGAKRKTSSHRKTPRRITVTAEPSIERAITCRKTARQHNTNLGEYGGIGDRAGVGAYASPLLDTRGQI